VCTAGIASDALLGVTNVTSRTAAIDAVELVQLRVVARMPSVVDIATTEAQTRTH
jgi:hypothetical protein